MSGSTVGVSGMALVGLVIGAAQIASQPKAGEPVAADPIAADAPTDPVVPPVPVVAAAPMAAMQAAPPQTQRMKTYWCTGLSDPDGSWPTLTGDEVLRWDERDAPFDASTGLFYPGPPKFTAP